MRPDTAPTKAIPELEASFHRKFLSDSTGRKVTQRFSLFLREKEASHSFLALLENDTELRELVGQWA